MRPISALFLLLQVLIVGGVAGYGSIRYQARFAPTGFPEPMNEPLHVTPRYDRPDFLSDAQLIAALDRLQPRLRGKNPKINHVDHALRFWGVEARFTDEECLSGVEMRDLLLDHRVFQDAWGTEEKPFLIPDFQKDSTLLSMRTKEGNASASHTDHSLASLAEVGTPLDFPVMAPDGEIELRAALEYTLAEFSLNQDEYEWSTMVFLHYLPHARDWKSTEGQTINWDRLADRLMRQRLADGVCFGYHRLFALVLMLNLQEEYALLSVDMHARVVAHLQDATQRLVASQHPDGYWDAQWPGLEQDGPQRGDKGSPLGERADRILATGHTLEWWALAPPEILPPEDSIRRAIQWTYSEVQDLSDSEIRSFYTFLTHAGRALSLWRGKMPHQVWKEHLSRQREQQVATARYLSHSEAERQQSQRTQTRPQQETAR